MKTSGFCIHTHGVALIYMSFFPKLLFLPDTTRSLVEAVLGLTSPRHAGVPVNICLYWKQL